MGNDLKKAVLWGGFFFCVAVLLMVPRWMSPQVSGGGEAQPLHAGDEQAPAPLPKAEELGIVLTPESFAPPAPAAREPEPVHVIRPTLSDEQKAMDEEMKELEKKGVFSY